LDSDLSQETSDGVLTLGVINLNQYRIRLVPANSQLAPVWLGANASAQSIVLAKSILIPAAGAIPAVSGVVNVAAAAAYGLVTDSLSAPLVGVSVELVASNGDVVEQTETLEDGTYSFNQIIPGTYSIRFATEGYADKTFRSVSLASAQTTTQNATLDSASGISGRVLATGQEYSQLLIASHRELAGNSNPEDVPVVGATVGLYAASGNGLTPLRTEVTDESGNYNFSGLVPGDYRIRIDGTTATRPAQQVWYLNGEGNASRFADATTVTAVRGELVRDINPATLKSWTAFTGLVKAGLYSVSGATVTLLPIGTGGAMAGETDADGFISIYAPDGDYLVRIQSAGYRIGYVSKSDDGLILETRVVNATVLHITQGHASFEGNVDLMSSPLDLAASGGTLQVQVTDGVKTLTEGVVKVYDRAGSVVAYVDSTTGGVFTIEGLRGEYWVSYELAGIYQRTFVGGTGALGDPKTVSVRVRDRNVSLAKIDVVALQKFTVNVKSGGASYAQPVTVNVYQQDGRNWSLQSDLSGSTFTGTYSFGVTRGESYRIQVVPDDLNGTSPWVGNATAANIDGATSFEVPLTGNAPTLPSVAIAAAVQVTVPLKNELDGALENVKVHLAVKQGTDTVDMASNYVGTLGSGDTEYVTFSHVPVSMFPIRVTGTSSNSAEVVWDSTGSAPSTNVTTGILSFSQVAVPASVSGYIKTVSGNAVANQTVTLVTDEGDEYATIQTDDTGKYEFTDLPLGVHFTVNSDTEIGFLVAEGDTDFTGRSGQKYEINFSQHFSVTFGGVVLDADGKPRADALVNIYRLSGSKLDLVNDEVFSVYTDEEGKWTFDGAEFGVEVGKFVFYSDGLDSDFTPAYLASLDCSAENLAVCATNKPDKAAVVVTDDATQSQTGLTLVLGAPDNSAPSGVKFKKSPTATTAVTPYWQWTGKDSIDGSALRSEIVISSAAYGSALSAWSDPLDFAGTSYSISGAKGSTYCISVRMVDKSGNASAFTAPSCTTLLMDDTAMKPVKSSLWSQVAVKSAYFGKVTAAKKKAKSAVLKISKSANGTGLCIYYVTGAKFGAFTVSVNGKKLGKPVKTAGKAGVVKSICYATKLKTTSKIAITVPKAGAGVQIDGYAITLAKPTSPKLPVANFRTTK